MSDEAYDPDENRHPPHSIWAAYRGHLSQRFPIWIEYMPTSRTKYGKIIYLDRTKAKRLRDQLSIALEEERDE